MKKAIRESNVIDFLLLPLLFVVLSFYIVYEQATNCVAIPMAEQLIRHKNMLAGNSEFFNPWQYRIFSTYTLELLSILFSNVTQNEYFAFFFFRFIQNILIFYVAYKFYRVLKIESKYLIILGILILGYNMSNSVFSSDLSFNTYFDILFYLTAGYLILIKKVAWILPLMVIAAFNRETSGFIPLMLIFSAINFKTKRIENYKNFRIGIGAFLIFLVIFISLRAYYGMPPAHGIHGMTSPIDFLKFNLTFFRMYPYLFGTLGIIPLIVILKFKTLSYPLRLFFLLIVPIWFLVHFLKSQAMETRLFLVPQALIFIPAFLQIVEEEIKSRLLKKLSL